MAKKMENHMETGVYEEETRLQTNAFSNALKLVLNARL